MTKTIPEIIAEIEALHPTLTLSQLKVILEDIVNNEQGSGTTTPTPSVNSLLLENGIDSLLMEDGTNPILMEA